MDSSDVARFIPEEEVRRKKNICSFGRRFFAAVVVLCLVALVVLFAIVFEISITNQDRYKSLESRYDNIQAIKEGKAKHSESFNELKHLIDRRINDSQHSLRRKVYARFDAVDGKLRNNVKEDKKIGTYVNNSFLNVTNNINELVATVDNLISRLSILNTSFDEKILNLRNTLTGIRGELQLLRNALNKVNQSQRTNLAHLSDKLTGLKIELRALSSSTTAKANELWRHWNDTNKDIRHTLNELQHQNSTLHLKVEYHSNALYAEVKEVEKRLARLSQNTSFVASKENKNIKMELNTTTRELQQLFHNEISSTNATLYKSIASIADTLKHSLTSINARVNAVKNALHANTTSLRNKQRETQDNLSRTKIHLQGVDRQHGRNISALANKIRSLARTNVQLKENLDSEKNKRKKLEKELRDLQAEVAKLKNKANGILQMRVHIVVCLAAVLLQYI